MELTPDMQRLLMSMMMERLGGAGGASSSSSSSRGGGGGCPCGDSSCGPSHTHQHHHGASSSSSNTTDVEQGRSRKYRLQYRMEEVAGSHPLAGAFAGLPYSNMLTVTAPNPVVPLKFEQPPGKWEGHSHICMEASNLGVFADDYVSPAVMRAHSKALEGYGCYKWQDAVQTANEALAISEVCPEAYNLLAVAAADSYKEALQHYRKAVELGPKVLKPGYFEQTLSERTMWGRVPYRAHVRALYGVANTLRKMGRYEESFEAYEQLLAADGNWHQGSSYVNVMALYPFVLMETQGPKAVLDYMKSYEHTDEHLSYPSSGVYWAAAYVMADLLVSEAKGVSVRAGGAAVTPDDNWAADGLDIGRLSAETYANSYKGLKCRPLFCFLHTFPQAVDLLLGDLALPAGLNPMCNSRGDRFGSAASLVYTTGSQWRSRPTVLDRLRRYRNTYEVRSLIQDLRYKKGLTVDVSDVRHYLKAPGGIHTHSLEREAYESGGGGRVRSLMYMLLDYPDGKEFTRDEIKVLQWLIEAGVPVVDTHPASPMDQPFHMACYQGYGPEVVRLLLAAGADPFQPNQQGLTAVAMTANQGNWREMQALLQARPQIKTANAVTARYGSDEMFGPIMKHLTVPEAMMLDLFNSSCLPCLAGGRNCMRCAGGIPHSPTADFFKYVDVLVEEAGVRRLHKAVLEEMEMAARQSGPNSPWSRLHKHVLRAITRQKKKPAAPKTNSTQQQQMSAAAAAAASSSSAAAAAGAAGSSSRGRSSAAGAGAAYAPPPSGVRACWGCGVTPRGDQSLQKCSGCRRAYFCSKACQVAAWKAHKGDCKKWQAEREQ